MSAISVIEISPTSIEIIICEKEKNGVKILENIKEELNLFLGSDKNDHISFEKANKLCNILKKMKSLSNDYNVKEILTVTTSSFDSIKNLPFILDQIKIKVGLDVKVFTPFEKKKLLFKKFIVRRKEIIPKNKNTLLFNIGSVTSDFFIINGNNLMVNESISTGGYKFTELIKEHNLTTKESMNFIEEYIENYLTEIKKEVGRKKISSVILLGEQESTITKSKNDFSICSYENFEKLMNNLKNESFENISKKYNLNNIQAIRTYARLCLLKYVSSYFKIPDIKIFYYDTKELMAYEYFFPKEKERLQNELWNLTIQAVSDKAKKYSFQKNHSLFVQKTSKEFFDVLKPLHNMKEIEKKHLELAAFFHDIGKYINFKGHHQHSQYILENSFIPGLTEEDLEIVGHLCYFHNMTSSKYTIRIKNISSEKLMDIMKLAAILKIVVSLDRSKRQKCKKITPKLQGDNLIINIDTHENYQIETIFFEDQKEFFKEIFGINPVLKINRRPYGE
jgi:exopolyphosphatase/guanosine-5'-triphosphate,3'-diphosphate pyrophosphatase